MKGEGAVAPFNGSTIIINFHTRVGVKEFLSAEDENTAPRMKLQFLLFPAPFQCLFQCLFTACVRLPVILPCDSLFPFSFSFNKTYHKHIFAGRATRKCKRRWKRHWEQTRHMATVRTVAGTARNHLKTTHACASVDLRSPFTPSTVDGRNIQSLSTTWTPSNPQLTVRDLARVFRPSTVVIRRGKKLLVAPGITTSNKKLLAHDLAPPPEAIQQPPQQDEHHPRPLAELQEEDEEPMGEHSHMETPMTSRSNTFATSSRGR